MLFIVTVHDVIVGLILFVALIAIVPRLVESLRRDRQIAAIRGAVVVLYGPQGDFTRPFLPECEVMVRRAVGKALRLPKECVLVDPWCEPGGPQVQGFFVTLIGKAQSRLGPETLARFERDVRRALPDGAVFKITSAARP